MMIRAILFGCFGVASAGCGPEAVAQAELGEVCGAASPFRVLELEGDDQVVMFSRPLHVGDRVLYVIRQRGVAEPDQSFPATTGTTVWATGPCGESPVRVATDIDKLFTLEVWPDVALGCDEATGNVVSLDPYGVLEPYVVFPEVDHTYGCGLRWTDYGVLDIEPHDEELGALLLHPYPADPRNDVSAPIVLLDPIRITASGHTGSGSIGDVLRTFEEFVLAVTPDDTLVRVELADGSVSTVLPDVPAFESSRDGRYLLWQDPVVTHDDPKYPEGKIFLRDQFDGSNALLGETALAYSMFPLTWVDRGIVQIGLGYFDKEPKRVFWLPGLEFVDVSPALFLNAQIDEERWIASSLASGLYDLIDLRRGDARELFPRPSQVRWIEDDALELLEVPPCCIETDGREEGPLWRVPFDGSSPQQRAKRATAGHRRLEDGRLVSPLSLDVQWLGPLVLIEPETQAEELVDERVFSYSLNLSWGEEEDIISYSVSDGERSGVYLARLPPREASRRGSVAPFVEAVVVDMVAGPDGRPVPRPRPVEQSQAERPNRNQMSS